MSISIRCDNPNCQKALRVKDELAGKRLKCPACGHVMLLPGQSIAPPPVPCSDAQTGSHSHSGHKGQAKERSAAKGKPTMDRHTSPQPRRVRWPWVAGAAAVIVLLGIGLALFFNVLKERQARQGSSKTELAAGSDPEAKPEPRPEPAPEPKPQPKAEPKPEPQEKPKSAEETAPTALLAYREHLPTESTINPTGFQNGRPLANKGTITKGTGETVHLNRSYAYDANGVGTVMDRSNTSHKDPKAITYKFDLKEYVDQLGRTLSVEGTITASSGETFQIQRKYAWDVNGVGTVTDKTKTTHSDPKAVTYQYDYVETINQIGQTVELEGTVTDSKGRKVKVRQVADDG